MKNGRPFLKKNDRMKKQNTGRRLFFITAIFLCAGILTAQVPDKSILTLHAPASFRAVFKTNKGAFIIEAYRKWSPMGVDRLYQLIKTGFYNNTMLFRAEQKFVIQFGISNSREINRFWDPKKLKDEPPLQKNKKGIIAFARGGINDRSTQLFINMVNNPLLDTVLRVGLRGYTPVAKVIKGMEVVAMINDRYGRSTLVIQDSVYKYGNRYLEVHYPGLDKIISANLIY